MVVTFALGDQLPSSTPEASARGANLLEDGLHTPLNLLAVMHPYQFICHLHGLPEFFGIVGVDIILAMLPVGLKVC